MNRSYSKHWYDNKLDFGLTYLGVPTVKCPLDLWVYQEIMVETKPDLVIETGTAWGGSALHMAHLFDAMGHGRVVSVDIAPQSPLPGHDRITYLQGMSSTDRAAVSHVARLADGKRCMVILDSDHRRQHVLDELNVYHQFVAKGCFLIVEDSNPDGYREFLARGDGPAEAIRDWQPTNRGFVVDRKRERLGFTQNPDGFLKRVR